MYVSIFNCFLEMYFPLSLSVRPSVGRSVGRLFDPSVCHNRAGSYTSMLLLKYLFTARHVDHMIFQIFPPTRWTLSGSWRAGSVTGEPWPTQPSAPRTTLHLKYSCKQVTLNLSDATYQEVTHLNISKDISKKRHNRRIHLLAFFLNL